MTSKADYLKRYLEGGTDTSAAAEKKKKKKKKAIVPGEYERQLLPCCAVTI